MLHSLQILSRISFLSETGSMEVDEISVSRRMLPRRISISMELYESEEEHLVLERYSCQMLYDLPAGRHLQVLLLYHGQSREMLALIQIVTLSELLIILL